MKIVTKNTEYRAMNIVGGSTKAIQICLVKKLDKGRCEILSEVGSFHSDAKMAKLVAGFLNSVR